MNPSEQLRILFQENNRPFQDWILEEYDPDALFLYYSFLKNTNERGGFFSRGDTERIFTRHFYESLIFTKYVSDHLQVSRETKLADAGTGPGLPGYLFFCRKEKPKLHLIDSSRRRLSLLENFHKETFPKDTHIHYLYSRLEELKNSYDAVVFRALIPFPFVLDLICHIIKMNGYAVYFSAATAEQNEDISERIEKLGFVSRETLVPGEVNIDTTRSIKILQKIKAPERGYPRPWKFLKEEIELCRK